MKYSILLLFCTVLLSCSSDNSENTTPTDDGSTNLECTAATFLTVRDVGITFLRVEYEFGENSSRSNLEYGEKGFISGQGTLIEDFSYINTIETNFKGETEYEFFITTICVDGTSIDSERKAFTTPVCPTPNIVDAINITETTATVRWSEGSFVGNYEVEYGEAGFALGTGMTQTSTVQEIELMNLSGGTLYDVYVRTNCGGEFGDYSNKFTFETTPLCFTPTNLRWSKLTISSIQFRWDRNGESNWQVEYGSPGFTIGTGTRFNTSTNPHRIEGLQFNTTYEIYMRANCGGQGFSNWSESLVVSTL